MTRARQADTRFDFRGGVNSHYSEDVLDRSELRRAKNARLFHQGSVEKRGGSQRIHDTALEAGAAVLGTFQWDAPAGKEVVATAGGNFHHKQYADLDFTTVVPTTAMSTTAPAFFAQFRESGGTVVLYIASGGTLYRWDGTTLSEPSGAPSAYYVTVYNGRVVVLDQSKTIHLSVLGDGTDWSAGNGAVTADVETYDLEAVLAAKPVGSSLALAKEDNIARWTGVDPQDIRIGTETEGISSQVGLTAEATLIQFDEVLFLLTQKGPYLADEASVHFVSDRVQDEFQEELNKSAWQDSVAAYHADRGEVWLFVPSSGSSVNDRGWIFDTQLGSWMGPQEFPFDVASAAAYERSDGTATVLVGGEDGFIRELDVLTGGKVLDDVARDGTGGSAVTMALELPTLHFGQPNRVKSLGRRMVQKIEADLGADDTGALDVKVESRWGSITRTINSDGPGVKDYPFVLGAKGKRLTVTLTEATSEPTRINGTILVASLERAYA